MKKLMVTEGLGEEETTLTTTFFYSSTKSKPVLVGNGNTVGSSDNTAVADSAHVLLESLPVAV